MDGYDHTSLRGSSSWSSSSIHLPTETLDWQDFEEVSTQVVDELGDIRAYPLGLAEAEERLAAVHELDLHLLVGDDVHIVEGEIEKCLDVCAWDRRELRLPEYTSILDGRVHTSQLAPHMPGERIAKPLYPLPRQYGRVRRIEVRRDLARYYRYGAEMRRERAKLVKHVAKAICSLSTAFEIFGKRARFALQTEDGEVMLACHSDLLNLRDLLDRLLIESDYIFRAGRIRNPFSPTEPLNYLGQHARAIFSTQVRAWIRSEPALSQLRAYIGEDFPICHLAMGMSTLSMMTAIIRSCIWSKVTSRRTPNGSRMHFYISTEPMRDLLGFPEEVGVLSLASLVRRHILSTASAWQGINDGAQLSSDELAFLNFQDDDPDEFPSLLALVQEFCDVAHMERNNGK